VGTPFFELRIVEAIENWVSKSKSESLNQFPEHEQIGAVATLGFVQNWQKYSFWLSSMI
jgi:hypothetical protein